MNLSEIWGAGKCCQKVNCQDSECGLIQNPLSNSDFPEISEIKVTQQTEKIGIQSSRVPRNRWIKAEDSGIWKKSEMESQPVRIAQVMLADGTVIPDGPGAQIDLTFQVADVNGPLLSMRRVVESRNRVCFCPNENDNYIENLSDGRKFRMVKKGICRFVMEVFMAGSGPTESVLDSGAEESVCPHWWGQQFGVNQTNYQLNLIDAQGNGIRHYGERNVRISSPF